MTSSLIGVRQILDELHPALLFVDGVSSIGSLEFCMDDWGIDIAVALPKRLYDADRACNRWSESKGSGLV